MRRAAPFLLCAGLGQAAFAAPVLAPQPEDTLAALDQRGVPMVASDPADPGLRSLIGYYRFLYESATDPRVHAEAQRRLADMQMEVIEERLIAVGRDLAGPGGGSLTGRAASARAAGNPLVSAALTSDYAVAIRLYEELLRRYPTYADTSGVYYQLAKAYDLSGDRRRSLLYLDTLVRRFPDSPFANEAHFRRAEILFAQGEYDTARDIYGEIAARGDATPFFTQAMYKRGWSRFALREFREGLDDFFQLIEHYRAIEESGKTLSRGEREVAEDTYRVVGLSFSYLGGPGMVRDYFAERGEKPYIANVFQALGDLYRRQERFQDAADAYALFIRLFPESPKLGMFQVAIIDVYDQARFGKLQLQAKEDLINRFGTRSEFWARLDEAGRAELAPHLRTHLADLGKFYHSQAQKSRRSFDYGLAARWYEELVEVFPDAPEAAEASFLLGDSFYEMGRFGDAAQYYERTAFRYTEADPVRRTEAGFAALQAYQQEIKRAGPEHVDDWRRRSIAASTRFAEAFPTYAMLPSIIAQAAEDQYALGDPLAAVGLARRVLGLDPTDEQRRQAWTVIANAEFDLKAYDRAEEAYGKLLVLTAPTARERGAIHERLAASIYRQGEIAREAGDLKAASQHFLRVGLVVPEAQVRPNAEFDAAAIMIQLGEWRAAIGVLEAFRSRYPTHPLQAGVPDKLALAYEETGQWSKAADELARIAGTSEPAVAREAVWRSAELQVKAGNVAAAVVAFSRYVASYPEPAETAIEARQKLADLYGKQGLDRERQIMLREMVEATKRAGLQATERMRVLASGAALVLADAVYQDFTAVRLTLPLERSLTRKRRALEQAVRAYGEVATFGVAATLTAANFRSAEIYRQLAKDLMESERPRGLDAEELEQYGILLEEQAIPFEERAIELHELNAARTRDGIYDDWVQKSFVALRDVMPGRYAKDEIRHGVFENLR